MDKLKLKYSNTKNGLVVILSIGDSDVRILFDAYAKRIRSGVYRMECGCKGLSLHRKDHEYSHSYFAPRFSMDEFLNFSKTLSQDEQDFILLNIGFFESVIHQTFREMPEFVE